MQYNLKIQTIHRLGFLFLTAVVLVCWQLDFTVNESILIKALAIGVLLAGIPHGAIDPVLAKKFGVWRTGTGLLMFALAYVAVAALMVVIWILAPSLTLAAFLLLSVWHFSGDWLQDLSRKESLPISLSLLTLPALFHITEVAQIFRLLTGEDATILTTSMATIAPIATLLAASSAIKAGMQGIDHGMEILVLLVCAALMPPIWFFLIYFCFLHSPRHILKTLNDNDGNTLLSSALLFTGITLVLAVIALLALPAISLDERILKVVFIGLFALTVPHMILIDFLKTGEHSEPE
jgi:Brp/Blh family beta-carotene 15,15'-monooxygenase